MNKMCENCGNKIETMTFWGEDWCSVICRKALGADTTSGNLVMLTWEEEQVIRELRGTA